MEQAHASLHTIDHAQLSVASLALVGHMEQAHASWYVRDLYSYVFLGYSNETQHDVTHKT